MQLTKGEALLSMQVQHRVTEKRMRYRHSFVQVRETKMGVFGKPKDRFAVLYKNVLAFFDPTAEEINPSKPLLLVEIGPSCIFTEVAASDSGYVPERLSLGLPPPLP